jgi:hypothetical protein
MVSEHTKPASSESGRDGLASAPVFADLEPLVSLLDNPDMARVYLTALDNETTVPELLDTLTPAKSTIYEYVHALERVGLLQEVGERSGATVYKGNEFTFSLEIDRRTVEVTPELVEILAHQDTAPEIQTFREQYGLATLTRFVDLAHEQARGEITSRMIAETLDISRGSAYDMLEHVHRILEIGGEPETNHADEIDNSEREELLDR